MLRFAGLLLSLVLLCPLAVPAAEQKAPAPPPLRVEGTYLGWVLLKQDGKPGPGDKVALKMSLNQFEDRLKGLVTVGQQVSDQIVFEISKGRVEGDYLWIEAQEWIWRLKLDGVITDGRLKGNLLVIEKDPAKHLPGDKKPAKKFVPLKMRGPMEMTRQ